MKLVKRILLILFIFFVVLIGLAIALPIIYKDKIVEMTKEEINKTVNARVEFEDVSLSLFRDFPNFSFQLKNFEVTGKEEFDGTLLAKGENADFSIDLMSLFSQSDPIKINAVGLRNPEINVLVLENGKANYDIAIETDERIEQTNQTTDYSGFKATLKSYEIENARITYDDQLGDMLLKIEDLDHKGSGNFTIDVFDLKTKTDIGAMSFDMGDIAYLKGAKVSLDAIFNIDQQNSKYTLKDNLLHVNALQLNADGFVQLIEEDILMDLAFSSPQNDFRSLWSLIPNAYIEGYEDVKIDGNFDLAGNVKGTYNESSLPAFDIKTNISGGKVKYPDLPMSINDINAKVAVNSPDTDLDKMTVDISRMGFRIGDNPMDGKLLVSTPISDPAVDGFVNGVLNLEDLANAFPIDGVDEMKGIITANIKMNARLSQMESEDYESVDIRGDAEIENLVYDMTGYPPVSIASSVLAFSPKMVDIKSFQGQLGQSDVTANGHIDNILAYFSPKKTMTGDMTLSSNYILVDEWMEEEASTTGGEPAYGSTSETTTESEAYEVFDRFNFKVDAAIDKLNYYDYQLTDLAAKGQIAPNKMDIDNFALKLGESDLSGSGTITNAFDYLFSEGTLGGDVKLKSNTFDLNPFMTESGEVPENSGEADLNTEAMEPILVPENIDMTVDADFRKIIYTNMTLRDLDGELRITPDRAVIINGATAETLQGTVKMNGGYYTSNPEDPKFDLDVDLVKMDFKDAFNTFNTFQKLAPVGNFMSGTFTTDMSMAGSLGKDMMPVFSSLNAEGFLHTINGFITDFKPLNAVGNALNIEELKGKLLVKDSKNWFTIENGKVKVEEFDYAVKDLKMKIAGTHSLENEMDYNIKAAIPREWLDKAGLNKLASSGLKSLSEQASKLGLDIAQGETVNVLINMTGSITDPKVKFSLLGLDGETSIADAAKETVKAAVDEKKEEIKKDLSAQAKKILDDAQVSADKIIAEAKKSADKIRAEGLSAADRIRNEGKTAADKIRAEGRKQAEDAKKAAEAEAQKQVDKASNPIAKAAARKLADRLLAEADKKADKLVAEADQKAAKLEDEAKKRATQTTDTAERNALKIENEAQERADQVMAEAQKQVDKLE
jgi:vacuolar-type H+-ATPase subunit E/Vma4